MLPVFDSVIVSIKLTPDIICRPEALCYMFSLPFARRAALQQALLAAALALLATLCAVPARAALLQLPATELNNDYYLVCSTSQQLSSSCYSLLHSGSCLCSSVGDTWQDTTHCP